MKANYNMVVNTFGTKQNKPCLEDPGPQTREEAQDGVVWATMSQACNLSARTE